MLPCLITSCRPWWTSLASPPPLLPRLLGHGTRRTMRCGGREPLTISQGPRRKAGHDFWGSHCSPPTHFLETQTVVTILFLFKLSCFYFPNKYTKLVFKPKSQRCEISVSWFPYRLPLEAVNNSVEVLGIRRKGFIVPGEKFSKTWVREPQLTPNMVFRHIELLLGIYSPPCIKGIIIHSLYGYFED